MKPPYEDWTDEVQNLVDKAFNEGWQAAMAHFKTQLIIKLAYTKHEFVAPFQHELIEYVKNLK